MQVFRSSANLKTSAASDVFCRTFLAYSTKKLLFSRCTDRVFSPQPESCCLKCLAVWEETTNGVKSKPASNCCTPIKLPDIRSARSDSYFHSLTQLFSVIFCYTTIKRLKKKKKFILPSVALVKVSATSD